MSGTRAAQVCGGHARTACLPTSEEMETRLTQTRLDTMRLPLLSLNPEPLIGVRVDDLMSDVSGLCAQDITCLSADFPDLRGDHAHKVAKQVHITGIVCGVFDKHLHTVSGVCKKMMDIHLLLDVILSPQVHHLGLGKLGEEC